MANFTVNVVPFSMLKEMSSPGSEGVAASSHRGGDLINKVNKLNFLF